MNPAEKIKIGASGLRQAWRAIRSSPSETLCAMTLDAGFLFTIGAVLEYFGSRVVETLLAIGTLMIPQSAASPDPIQASLFGNPAQGLEIRVFALLILMALSVFCAFCTIAGSSHWIAYRRAGKKIRYARFIASFTRVSAAFFPAYLAYESLGYLHDFNTLSAERMPGLGYWDPSYLVPIIGILTAYLSLMSLSRLEEGTARGAIRLGFRCGIRDIVSTILMCIPMILLIAIVELASRAALSIGMAARAAAVLVVLAMLTLIRTSLVITLDSTLDSKSEPGETGETVR